MGEGGGGRGRGRKIGKSKGISAFTYVCSLSLNSPLPPPSSLPPFSLSFLFSPTLTAIPCCLLLSSLPPISPLLHTHTSAGVMFRQKFLQWFPSSAHSNHDGAPQDPYKTELLRFSKLQVGREELEVDRQTDRWMNRQTHIVVRS